MTRSGVACHLAADCSAVRNRSVGTSRPLMAAASQSAADFHSPAPPSPRSQAPPCASGRRPQYTLGGRDKESQQRISFLFDSSSSYSSTSSCFCSSFTISTSPPVPAGWALRGSGVFGLTGSHTVFSAQSALSRSLFSPSLHLRPSLFSL